MDPEHDDYADSTDPRRGSPLVVLALIGVVIVLAALVFLPFLGLGVSNALGLED